MSNAKITENYQWITPPLEVKRPTNYYPHADSWPITSPHKIAYIDVRDETPLQTKPQPCINFWSWVKLQFILHFKKPITAYLDSRDNIAFAQSRTLPKLLLILVVTHLRILLIKRIFRQATNNQDILVMTKANEALLCLENLTRTHKKLFRFILRGFKGQVPEI